MIDVTEQHLDDPNIMATDSCAVPDHPVMSRLWSERKPIGTIVVGLTPQADRAGAAGRLAAPPLPRDAQHGAPDPQPGKATAQALSPTPPSGGRAWYTSLKGFRLRSTRAVTKTRRTRCGCRGSRRRGRQTPDRGKRSRTAPPISPSLMIGKKLLRRMRHEVGDRHLAGQDEGDRPREQAKHDQDAADDFQHGGEAEQRKQRRAHAGVGKAEQLARVPCEMNSSAVMTRRIGEDLRAKGRQTRGEAGQCWYPLLGWAAERRIDAPNLKIPHCSIK